MAYTMAIGLVGTFALPDVTGRRDSEAFVGSSYDTRKGSARLIEALAQDNPYFDWAARTLAHAKDPQRDSTSAAREDLTRDLCAVGHDGDRDAFVRLYKYYGPRLRSFLLGQGASAGEAEEVIQDTMMTVWRKAGMFDPAKAAAGTWIFTIARNLRIDALRKANRPLPEPDDPVMAPQPLASPERMSELAQVGDRVVSALSAMPEEQATAVHMSFFEDKSHGEIARELGVPLGTVKSRLRLAMQRLKQEMGETA